MTTWMQDLKYAWRQLRQSPGFALTVVLTLALGIGANTAVFTLVHAVFLRSLPVADPGQLYRIGDKDDCCVDGGFIGDPAIGDFDIFSYDLYLHLKKSAPEFTQLAAMQSGINSYNLRRGNEPAKVELAEYVSGNYFTTFGVSAHAGRMMTASDDAQGAAPAVVMSYQAWVVDYGSDPSIVGSTFFIQGHPVTVIGIAHAGFFGDRVRDDPPALWLPLNLQPYLEGSDAYLHDAEANWLYAVGRLPDHTNLNALQQKISGALRNWLWTQPIYTKTGGDKLIPAQHVILAGASGGIQNLQQQTGSGLKLLVVLSALVLCIACANIANLLLARGTARRAEISLRVALGAGRGRLVRQMLTESVLLSLIGGVTGLIVAYVGSRAILALAFPDATQLPIQASPSIPVLGFALALSFLTGIAFGIAPAWASSGPEPAEALRGGKRTTRDHAPLLQRSLVVLQAALSLVLLVGAGLLTQSLRRVEHQDFGLRTENRYVVQLHPDGAGYTRDRLPQLYEQMERRFAALPGVQHVGLALYSPLQGDNWSDCVSIQGRPQPGVNDDCSASWDRVSTDFFATVGQPIVRGRGFTAQDTATSPPVAVVSQAFVKYFFPHQDPIGQHFGTGGPGLEGSFEIVGVAKDAKYNNPRDDYRRFFFRPLTQQLTTYKNHMRQGEMRSMFIDSLLLDFQSPQPNVDRLVRKTLADIDPALTIETLRSMDVQVADNFNQERLIARLTGMFGLIALALAALGLYAVTAYAVARRTSEIGIRMALGATRISVVRMVLNSALLQIVLGLAIGVPATLIGSHLIASQLFGVSSYDPLIMGAAILILCVTAALAAMVPARRAASIEPMQALRTE
jgi:predicted permease